MISSYGYDEIAIPATFTDRDGYVAMAIRDCRLHYQLLQAVCATQYESAVQAVPISKSPGYIHYRVAHREPGVIATPPAPNDHSADVGNVDALAIAQRDLDSSAGADRSARASATETTAVSLGETRTVLANPPQVATQRPVLVNGVPVSIPARTQKPAPHMGTSDDPVGDRMLVLLTGDTQQHYLSWHGRIVAPGDAVPDGIAAGAWIEAIDAHAETIQIVDAAGVCQQGDLFDDANA